MKKILLLAAFIFITLAAVVALNWVWDPFIGEGSRIAAFIILGLWVVGLFLIGAMTPPDKNQPPRGGIVQKRRRP